MTKRYRPGRTSGGYAGERDTAKVQLHPDGKRVRVKLKDAGTTVVMRRDKCPKQLVNGTFQVTLTDDGTGIHNFRPIEGTFHGRVSKFPAKKGEQPAPKTKDVDFVNDEGTRIKYSYRYFTVLFEITRGELKSLEIPYTLRYKFDEAVPSQMDENGNEIPWQRDGKPFLWLDGGGKYVDQLDELLEKTGVWERGPMPYQDNVLSMLQKRMLAAGKEFQFLIKGGWITSLFSSSGDYDSEWGAPD